MHFFLVGVDDFFLSNFLSDVFIEISCPKWLCYNRRFGRVSISIKLEKKVIAIRILERENKIITHYTCTRLYAGHRGSNYAYTRTMAASYGTLFAL